MFGEIKIDIMAFCDVEESMNLWKSQFAFFCKDNVIYPSWENNTDSIEKYISDKSKRGNALIAKRDGKTVGFISFDIFNFHGVESAICHFCGSASAIEERQSIYLAMYYKMCEYCVEKSVLTHYISICNNDIETKELLFNLGFGAYGADAFVHFDQALSHRSDYDISIASIFDTQAVYNLRNKAVDYFIKSPIYLRLEPCSIALIEQKIKSEKVYVAKDNGNIIGIMDLEIAEDNNIYRMYTKGCGVVCGEVGAFIKDEYRDKGVGSHFMQTISEYCIQNNLNCAHVPWETANPSANRFWRKFFTPTILSLKRTLHSDI